MEPEVWVFGGAAVVGLVFGLPLTFRFYTVYFAAFPIARFDSHKLLTVTHEKAKDFSGRGARERDVSPSPAPHPLNAPEEKVSGISPV